MITGAASGIGKATALLFGQEGAAVALADLDRARAQQAAEAIISQGGTAISCSLDVTSEAEWQRVLDDLLEKWKRLDVLVNNVNTVSSGGVMTPMWESMEFWQELKDQPGSIEASYQALAEGVPLKRLATAEEVARAILYLASDESSFVTGADLVIDGGYTA